jgi:hypothetical protein
MAKLLEEQMLILMGRPGNISDTTIAAKEMYIICYVHSLHTVCCVTNNDHEILNLFS